MDKKAFAELGLSPEMLKAVARLGFEEATPIQSEAIPPLLTGRDFVGQSQTGSGKTAAYAIPVIEQVVAERKAPQALILCPTRELAIQVAEEVAKLSLFKRGVRELPIYGGASYERQLRGLQEGAQIIIGTPGRVVDHLDRGTLKLTDLRMVVLDEADRMLDMGFRDEIEGILARMPEKRQTILFSATLAPPIRDLIRRFTHDPANVRIESQEMTVPAIEQVYYEVERRSKMDVLCRLLDLDGVRLGIIFCATKVMVDELTAHLAARGYRAEALHGDLSQAMRERVMTRFRQRQVELLVATDVAARGLDVDDVEAVFNYDLPHDGDDYVHRIGRTGRAGKTGRAITFVAGREIYKLQNIQRFTKARIQRARVPSLYEVEERRMESLFERVRETLEEGSFRRHEDALDRLLERGHTPTDIASALIHLLSNGTDKPASPQPAANGGPPTPKEPPRMDEDRPARDREPAGGQVMTAPPLPRSKRPRPADGPPSATSHEPGMTRLLLNVGERNDVQPGDIVGVIAGVTRLNKEVVGAIRILPKQSLVDVADAHVEAVRRKLAGIQFKGRKLSVELATRPR